VKHLLEKSLCDLEGIKQEHIDLMAQHWQLLKSWNKRTNLTAITSDEEAAWLHYRDSLEALKVLSTGGVLDIGSGGGFPGIPIAIVSGRDVALMEPRRRKASFLETAVARLGLGQVRVLRCKSTDDVSCKFENVMTRATFSDQKDLAACRKWVEPRGRLIAMRADAIVGSDEHSYTISGRTRILAVLEQP